MAKPSWGNTKRTCVQAKCIKREGHGTDHGAWDGTLIMRLSWPPKSRMSENDIIQKAHNAANNDKHCWALKHLPNVLYAKDQNISLLSQALIDCVGGKYEECVLRIIVQLYPITEQTATVDLAQSFCEIFKCMLQVALWDIKDSSLEYQSQQFDALQEKQ